MPATETRLDQLTYVREEVDVPTLAKAWTNTLAGLDYYLEQSRRNYDNRRNYWSGKTSDNRKHGPKAVPWDGASDMDVQVIQERIQKYVALCLRALSRSHVQGYPVEESDVARARLVGRFLKWMRSTWIQDYDKQAEQTANYGFEKGLWITHVGWERRDVPVLEEVLAEELREDIQAMLGDRDNDDAIADLLMMEFPTLSEKRAKKAARSLRTDGKATFPVAVSEVDRPKVSACAPDNDVFFPPWTKDPQRAPYCFFRELVTPQDILTRVASDGWDREWAEHIIETSRGKGSLNPGLNNRDSIPNSPLSRYQQSDNDLIEVVWMYQRLIDDDGDDSVEGIYCTIFAPTYTGGGEAQTYAKRYLMSGATNYPLIVTPLHDDESRLYDIRTFGDLMRSAQNTVKSGRDAREDRNGLATCPPLLYPYARPPKGSWAPGGRIGYRRGYEYQFADVPSPNPQAVQDEEIILRQIDRMVGLDPEDDAGLALQDYYIRRFLGHQAKVLSLAYEQYQSYGPEERFFQVTGHPDMERMSKIPGEKLDITITFDTLYDDPESIEKMIAAVGTLFQFDDAGRLDKDAWLGVALSAISPTYSDQLLKPAEESRRDFERKVVDDLARIHAGFEVNAQPHGAPMAMQIVQRWASQPDIAMQLQNNELMMARVQKYLMQYVFQVQQQENAVTGRLGTPPAAFDVTDRALGGNPAANGNGR